MFVDTMYKQMILFSLNHPGKKKEVIYLCVFFTISLKNVRDTTVYKESKLSEVYTNIEK